MSDVRTLPTAEPLPENPIGIAPRPTGFCSHDSVILDEHERTIHCRKCDATLDAFDFMQRSARTLQRAWESYAHVQREVRAIDERLTELKKQEKRLRAQVRRLQEKVAPLATPSRSS